MSVCVCGVYFGVGLYMWFGVWTVESAGVCGYVLCCMIVCVVCAWWMFCTVCGVVYCLCDVVCVVCIWGSAVCVVWCVYCGVGYMCVVYSVVQVCVWCAVCVLCV